MDYIQDKTGPARLLELQGDIADIEQHAGLHLLNVEPLDGQVLASGARLQLKTLIDQVTHDLDIENTDRPLGADVLGVCVAIAFDAGFGHGTGFQRALRHTAVRNANRNDASFYVGY